MNAKQQSNGCDFFDVDHTVVNGSTGVQSLFTGIELKILPWRILYSVPKLQLQYRYGNLDTHITKECIRDLAGIHKNDILHIGRVNFSKRIQSRIFHDAALCIQDRALSGRVPVFLTSSFMHIIRPLADYLRVNHILANALLYDNDRTSGYLQEPFLFGKQKKNQALAFMKLHGFSPAHCSFFTDSHNDLSLLEIVGEPVAVNPDRRLKNIARMRNWRIERFR